MFLALVLVAVAVGLAYRGWDFYQLPVEDRPEHPLYKTLRPAGFWGAGYGWIAAMLIVLNLSYLIRRRFGGSKLGSMRVWLDAHVFTGLLASVLVSFHSAFQIRNPVAIMSTVSLTLVVLTGLLGRFLYALAPSGARERLKAALDQMEATAPDSRAIVADAISAHPGPDVPANASLLRSLFAIPGWRRAGRLRKKAIKKMLPRKQLTKQGRRARKDLIAAAMLDARNAGVHALLRTWRGLHRIFAFAMLAAVIFHAVVAWRLGYGRWIFS